MAIMTKGQGAVRLPKTLIILACCLAHLTLEAKAAPSMSKTGVMGYLSEFGYLPPMSPKSQAIMSDDTMSKAISEFQSFVGINVTGKMDAETTHMMTLPRCGVKDKVKLSVSRRWKRWAPFGSPWEKKSLTYQITKYPRRLDKTTVDHEIAKALGVWSDYTDLTFTPTSRGADIEIRFERGYHGDDGPFDGQGNGMSNTLAHAYAPGSGRGGDTHFDDDEEWTVDSYSGINLFQVAAHEFGHALGLAHSPVSAALMAPTYKRYEPNFQLHTDDIQGIQSLYGSKTENGGHVPKTKGRAHWPSFGNGRYWPTIDFGKYWPTTGFQGFWR